jgi:hypothetical protein
MIKYGLLKNKLKFNFYTLIATTRLLSGVEVGGGNKMQIYRALAKTIIVLFLAKAEIFIN